MMCEGNAPVAAASPPPGVDSLSAPHYRGRLSGRDSLASQPRFPQAPGESFLHDSMPICSCDIVHPRPDGIPLRGSHTRANSNTVRLKNGKRRGFRLIPAGEGYETHAFSGKHAELSRRGKRTTQELCLRRVRSRVNAGACSTRSVAREAFGMQVIRGRKGSPGFPMRNAKP